MEEESVDDDDGGGGASEYVKIETENVVGAKSQRVIGVTSKLLAKLLYAHNFN